MSHHICNLPSPTHQFHINNLVLEQWKWKQIINWSCWLDYMQLPHHHPPPPPPPQKRKEKKLKTNKRFFKPTKTHIWTFVLLKKNNNNNNNSSCEVHACTIIVKSMWNLPSPSIKHIPSPAAFGPPLVALSGLRDLTANIALWLSCEKSMPSCEQHNIIQNNITIQHNMMQNNTTQNNTSQHYTTQHSITQHNIIQHNIIQHNIV